MGRTVVYREYNKLTFFRGEPYFFPLGDDKGTMLVESRFCRNLYSTSEDHILIPFPLKLAIAMGLSLESYKEGVLEDKYIHDDYSFADQGTKVEGAEGLIDLFPKGNKKHFIYCVSVPGVSAWDPMLVEEKPFFTFKNGITGGKRSLRCAKYVHMSGGVGTYCSGNLYQSNKIFLWSAHKYATLVIPLYSTIIVP